MSEWMDAIVKPQAGPGLELRRVPVPRPRAGEVLIKVHKAAICGTDVHIYNWDPWAVEHIKPPMTVGHEYAGEVAALGDGVTGLRLCQRVSGEGHIACRRCRNGNIQWCKDTVSVGVDRDGAFAEYVCIPETNVILIAGQGARKRPLFPRRDGEAGLRPAARGAPHLSLIHISEPTRLL